ncbi:MAG: thermonuclease family protein [Pseudomonadota bacterium]
MRKIHSSFAIVLIACSAHCAWAWSGKVTYVTDGDTVWVQPAQGGRPVKIRIQGIDAPEICQAGGAAARAALKSRVLEQTVSISPKRLDDYGRVLANVDWQGQDIGRWMVSTGHAWSYSYRRNPGPYAAEQSQAAAARRGLFAGSAAENPRRFRQRHGSCHSGA